MSDGDALMEELNARFRTKSNFTRAKHKLLSLLNSNTNKTDVENDFDVAMGPGIHLMYLNASPTGVHLMYLNA